MMLAKLLLSLMTLTGPPTDPGPKLPELICVERQGKASLWIEKRRRQSLHLRLSDTSIVVVRVDGDDVLEVNETEKLQQGDSLWLQVVAEPRPGARARHWQKVYRATPMRPGIHALKIPSLQYSEGDGAEVEVKWQPLTVRVTTRIAKVDISEARDIAPIEQLPSPATATEAEPRWPWLLLALPLGIVGVAAVWALRHRYRGARELCARDVVLRHLDQLQAEPPGDPAQVERWHARLSDLLRWYLEKRLSLPATRQTTAEFFQALEHSGKVAPAEQAQLNELLAQCDLAKFARVVPAPEDCQRLAEAARAFVAKE